MQYLIHIGYPKAASSLLQSTLFSGQDEHIKPLNIDGKPYTGYQKSGGRLFFNTRAHDVSYLDPFVFDEQAVLSNIQSQENKKAKITCLSNELWAGHPFSGGITAKEYAERFHKTLPQAKVLIVMRNQIDMILSSYVHYIVNSKGFCSLEHFLTNNQHTQIPFHNLSYYCYDRLVKHYTDLFGKDQVLVLPFEVLTHDGQDSFFQHIYDFLGIKNTLEAQSHEKNQADYSKYVLLKAMPFLNLLSREGPINSFRPFRLFAIRDCLLKAGKHFISQKQIKETIERDKVMIRSFIDDKIIESNKSLQNYTAVDLKSLGYIFD